MAKRVFPLPINTNLEASTLFLSTLFLSYTTRANFSAPALRIFRQLPRSSHHDHTTPNTSEMSPPNNFSCDFNSPHQPQTQAGHYTHAHTPTPSTCTPTGPNSQPQTQPTNNAAPAARMQPYNMTQAYNVPYSSGRRGAISGSSGAPQADLYGWEASYMMRYGGAGMANVDGAGGHHGYEAGSYVTVVPQGGQGAQSYQDTQDAQDAQDAQGAQGAQGKQSGYGQGWDRQQR